MDVEPFRSMVTLKAGQPFSMAALRDSVAALQQSHEFNQVQVEVTPQPAGLRVVFILQPADYIGLISFPGADRTFAYTQLLQAVNISEQSPYVESQIDSGKEALAHFLTSNGYFAAAVDARMQRDDAHRMVNVAFSVKLNRLARIGAINIAGATPADADATRRALRSWWARLRGDSLRPGQKYSRQRLMKVTGYVRNHLRKEGRLAPVVRLDAPAYRAESNRADINFQIQEGELLSVRVVGARVSQRNAEASGADF